MAYLIFIDESGSDLNNSTYEVFAGLVIKDIDVWKIINEVHKLEKSIFGCRYSEGKRELKGKKILKRKTYRLANQLPTISNEERKALVFENLTNNAVSKRHLTALGQAKIAFVKAVLEMLKRFNCMVFASIISNKPECDNSDVLSNNYQFIFENFGSFLSSKPANEIGILVFDEVEKSHSHKLIKKIDDYVKTEIGDLNMPELIIPEPFFVESDLSTGIQLADLIAYIVSWSFTKEESEKSRTELKELFALVNKLAKNGEIKIKYFE